MKAASARFEMDNLRASIRAFDSELCIILVSEYGDDLAEIVIKHGTVELRRFVSPRTLPIAPDMTFRIEP